MGLWDGRFEESPTKLVAEFTESISFDKRLYKYDIAGSKAHAQMLRDVGIISEEAFVKIRDGLDEISSRIEKGTFEFKVELEDIHMHIESALTEIIGEDGAKLHTGRSRNDQIVLDLRLYLRDEVNSIILKLKSLQLALVNVANKNISVIMPGYTHMQRAQPILFAHHLLAYVEMFDRDNERLSDLLKRINVNPLGAGAIAGTTLAIDREITTKLLGFDRMTRNSIDAVSDRDFACELLSAISLIGMHISRLSEDIIIWSTSEFNFIELSDAFTTGSSLMPQKKNPDIAELSRGKTARLYGNMTSLFTMLKGLPLSYNRDMQEDKERIFDSIDTVKKTLDVYTLMIQEMKIKNSFMREAASDPCLMATDLAEKLVELGLAFRIAHHRTGALVKWCKINNKKLNSISLEEMQRIIPEATKECVTLFFPDTSIKKRKIFGATAESEVKKQLAYWKQFLA